MKLANYIVAILIQTVFGFRGLGTPQTPDRLIYNGDTVPIFYSPLEQVSNFEGIKSKLFGDIQANNPVANAKEYKADWEILNNQLYLTGIYSGVHDSKIQTNLKQLFPDQFENGKVKASWVTRNLIIPKGKFLFYVYGYNYYVYERQIVLVIKEGRLIEVKNCDNSKSKQSEFSSNSQKLMTHIYSSVNWDKLPKQDHTVKVFIRFSANEMGRIDSVRIVKGYNEIFDNEAKRVVFTIPEWEVIYRLGQHDRIPLQLQIVFSEENRQKYKK